MTLLFSKTNSIKLDWLVITPAKIERSPNVYFRKSFLLIKNRWVSDEEAQNCFSCQQRFNKLRRKHHCRQCGQVLCNKCCSEKMVLPQFGSTELERVCENCLEVADLVAKSFSLSTFIQIEAAEGLAKFTHDAPKIKRLLEQGGLQALIILGQQGHIRIRKAVFSSLHNLFLHPVLHFILAETGALKAICSILLILKKDNSSEQIIVDCISSLMVFSQKPALPTKAVEDGALQAILSLCDSNINIVLLALRTLNLILKYSENYSAVLEANKLLSTVLSLVGSQDEQIQEVCLKILADLSYGGELYHQRILQEEFSSGKKILAILKNKPQHLQVLCNAICLIANLAAFEQSQNCLQEYMEQILNYISLSNTNSEFQEELSRSLANFSKHWQNSTKLLPHFSLVMNHFVKSSSHIIKWYGVQFCLYLMCHKNIDILQVLSREDGQILLNNLITSPEIFQSIQRSIQQFAPEIRKS